LGRYRKNKVTHEASITQHPKGGVQEASTSPRGITSWQRNQWK